MRRSLFKTLVAAALIAAVFAGRAGRTTKARSQQHIATEEDADVLAILNLNLSSPTQSTMTFGNMKTNFFDTCSKIGDGNTLIGTMTEWKPNGFAKLINVVNFANTFDCSVKFGKSAFDLYMSRKNTNSARFKYNTAKFILMSSKLTLNLASLFAPPMGGLACMVGDKGLDHAVNAVNDMEAMHLKMTAARNAWHKQRPLLLEQMNAAQQQEQKALLATQFKEMRDSVRSLQFQYMYMHMYAEAEAKEQGLTYSGANDDTVFDFEDPLDYEAWILGTEYTIPQTCQPEGEQVDLEQMMREEIALDLDCASHRWSRIVL